jgi:hypothetical protein
MCDTTRPAAGTEFTDGAECPGAAGTDGAEGTAGREGTAGADGAATGAEGAATGADGTETCGLGVDPATWEVDTVGAPTLPAAKALVTSSTIAPANTVDAKIQRPCHGMRTISCGPAARRSLPTLVSMP